MTVPVPEVIIAVFVDTREGNHVVVAIAAAASVDNNIIINEKDEKDRCTVCTQSKIVSWTDRNTYSAMQCDLRKDPRRSTNMHGIRRSVCCIYQVIAMATSDVRQK